MKVLLFGATGMVGTGVLLECLDDPRVTEVVSLTRRPGGRTHPKLREVVHGDFFDYGQVTSDLAGAGACFFTLGVSAAGKSDAEYHRLTYDLTLAAAAAVAKVSPDCVFCYVTGAGTDETEQGRFMWARVKGKTENALLRLPFRAAYMFRPGYIQPRRGATSSTPLYRALYVFVAPLYPLLERLVPRHLTTTEKVGRAMIEAAVAGAPSPRLEVADINALAARHPAS